MLHCRAKEFINPGEAMLSQARYAATLIAEKATPMGWTPQRACRSEGDTRRFKQRVVAITRGRKPSWSLARWFRNANPITVVLLATLACMTALLASKVWQTDRPWPAQITLRHMAAAPNCDAARAVGLAPAMHGQPGYYPKHDRDYDGIACEPWAKSSKR